jgi:hypothetical protein
VPRKGHLFVYKWLGIVFALCKIVTIHSRDNERFDFTDSPRTKSSFMSCFRLQKKRGVRKVNRSFIIHKMEIRSYKKSMSGLEIYCRIFYVARTLL